MTYDGLNRISSKSYNDSPNTAAVSYAYDTGGSAVNANSRLITVTAGSGNAAQSYTRSYDLMGVWRPVRRLRDR
jgi:hypothetical protein